MGKLQSHNARATPTNRSSSGTPLCCGPRPALCRRKRQSGFTLLETIFAITILTVGLLAVALLVARSSQGSERSRYMSMAAGAASEKLEDLVRYPPSDAQVNVPAGSTSVGSLSSDATASITVGSTTTLYYYDDVQVSASGGQTATGFGAITTVQTVSNGAGGTCYNVFYHQANGTVSDTACSSTAPTPGPDVLTFHRRWMIESPVTVNGTSVTGVRRITVLSTLSNTFVNPPVTFQMSVIRQ